MPWRKNRSYDLQGAQRATQKRSKRAAARDYRDENTSPQQQQHNEPQQISPGQSLARLRKAGSRGELITEAAVVRGIRGEAGDRGRVGSRKRALCNKPFLSSRLAIVCAPSVYSQEPRCCASRTHGVSCMLRLLPPPRRGAKKGGALFYLPSGPCGTHAPSFSRARRPCPSLVVPLHCCVRHARCRASLTILLHAPGGRVRWNHCVTDDHHTIELRHNGLTGRREIIVDDMRVVRRVSLSPAASSSGSSWGMRWREEADHATIARQRRTGRAAPHHFMAPPTYSVSRAASWALSLSVSDARTSGTMPSL